MDLHEFSLIFIDFYGFQQIYMDFHGFPSFFVDLRGFAGQMHPLGAPKRWCSDVGCPVPRSSDTGGSDTRILEARILEA